MKVVDPGHIYGMKVIDGQGNMPLTFVKRDDPPEKYPGNEGHHCGVIIQEVLRVLIDRVKYLDNQIPSSGNMRVISDFRHAFLELEVRAHFRHNSVFPLQKCTEYKGIENIPPCEKCGHLFCSWCEDEVA